VLVWLTEHIDSRPLGLARIGVGVAALLKALITIPILFRLTQPEILAFPYFDWVPRPTVSLVVVIGSFWLVSAVLFTLGWRVAVSGSVLTVTLALVLAIDQQTYSNHLYLMAWLVFLLTLARAGSGFSISRSDEPVVRWPVLLLMVQLSVVYGFSGITKINPGFLSGSVLAGSLQGGVIPFPDFLITPQFLSALAGVVIAVECALALLIWHTRLRLGSFFSVSASMRRSLSSCRPRPSWRCSRSRCLLCIRCSSHTEPMRWTCRPSLGASGGSRLLRASSRGLL
jgi:hypothetical protein